MLLFNKEREVTMEIYKVHPIYDRIKISNYGNVRCVKSNRIRYTKKSKSGYICLMYKINDKPKLLKVHRLVAETHLAPPSDELINKCSKEHWGYVLVRHLDNDKTNNHVSNLEWCDHETNYRQAFEEGLIPPLKGELNGRAVLTEDLVHKVCQFYQDGGQPLEAQALFGISRPQATKIKSGHAWKHIWEQYDIKVNRRRNFIDQNGSS